MSATCPWCAAPRGAGPSCASCGANYAKAEAIRTQGKATKIETAPAVTAPPKGLLRDPAEAMEAVDPHELPDIDDPDLEWKFRLGAIPAALLLALAWQASGLGHSLQRIFFTMPVHELGHAITAWFCGFAAIPTLWKTIVPEERGFIFPTLMLGALGYLIYRAHLANRRDWIAAGIVMILLQAICTLGFKETTARMLIVFGGDGLGMVLAAVLMGMFFYGRDTQLYRGSLRWGFVVIGAAAFVDMYATWWVARNDYGIIPFGEQNGTPTDASTLVDEFRWSHQALVMRYVVLGLACLFGLAVAYVWGVLRARQTLLRAAGES